jgi:hypothetical protein
MKAKPPKDEGFGSDTPTWCIWLLLSMAVLLPLVMFFALQ